jgi:DNA-binding response OmpR family regulator
VVEDEPNIAAIILFKLAREGHSVRHAEDAAELHAELQRFHPDLVLLDSTLPDADALAELRDLRDRCAVAFMTEFRDRGTPEQARAAGARAVIEKPFKPTQLARLVAELCPRR